jgi:hypothetical protein
MQIRTVGCMIWEGRGRQIMAQFKVFAFVWRDQGKRRKSSRRTPGLLTGIELGTPRLRITGTQRVVAEAKEEKNSGIQAVAR